MSLFDDKIAFAKSLGYKNVSDALGHMTVYEFNKMFAERNQKIITVDKPKKKRKSYKKWKYIEGTNDMYQIYPNGKVYSLWFGGSWMKHIPTVRKKNHEVHYQVKLTYKGNRTGLYINRLIMYYFGEHNYKNIEDMPDVMFINGDTSDFRLSNLKFAKKGEIIKIINDKRAEDSNAKIKDTNQNISKVKNMLAYGFTLDEIGSVFGCSGMSVYRFKKRNKL